MLGLFSKETKPVVIRELGVIVPPSPLAYSAKDDGRSEWFALARELGVTPSRTDRVELEMFLEEEGMPIYKTQTVFDYLGERAKKVSNGKWDFWPIRECDKGQKAGSAMVRTWPSGMGITQVECYHTLIPLPVLLTVKRLLDKFGEDAHFFVAAVDDDPFLAVRLRDSALLFVERWDEPGFRR